MYVDGGSVSLASVLFEGNRAEAHQVLCVAPHTVCL